MKAFLSRYSYKIDRKGRVSVPAEYRSTLAELGSDGILAFPSLSDRAIRCATTALIEKVTQNADPMTLFEPGAPSRAALSLPDIIRLVPDPEGRVILPEGLIAHAGITDVALFAGLGNHFEIWAPEAFEQHRHTLRAQLSGGRP
jgi:MraZ protein